jgi:hypothetical protein
VPTGRRCGCSAPRATTARGAATPAACSRGAEGIVAAAAEAGVLVAGLSDSWRRDGVGGVRAEAAQRARPPALLVRRGPRPGGLAPRENLTRYTWSLALPDPGG